MASGWSEKLKLDGNDFFKMEQYEHAAEKYTAALNALSGGFGGQQRNPRAILLSNRAACHLALNRWGDAIKDCRASLAVDSSFLKSHLRLSKALEGNGDLRGALQSAVAAVQLCMRENGGHQGMVDKGALCEVDRLLKLVFGGADLTARWRRLRVTVDPPLVAQNSAVEWRGKVYLFGGVNISHMRVGNRVHVFNTYTTEWTTPPTFGTPPEARSEHGAFVYNDGMFICGGDHSPIFDMWRLDLATFRWTPVQFRGDKRFCPPGIAQHMVSVHGDRLLVWGGRLASIKAQDRRSHEDYLYIFYLGTGEWRRFPWQGSYRPRAVQDRGVWLCQRGIAGDRSATRETINVESEAAKELVAFYGSRRNYSTALGTFMDESFIALDRLSIENQRWEPMPMLGLEKPSARAELAVLHLQEHEVTVFWGGYYEGAIRMDGSCYFNDTWLFHHQLGVWTKLTNKGDRVPSGAQFWLIQRREDGKIFGGGGFCGSPKPRMFGDVYELVIPYLQSCPAPPKPLIHPPAKDGARNQAASRAVSTSPRAKDGGQNQAVNGKLSPVAAQGAGKGIAANTVTGALNGAAYSVVPQSLHAPEELEIMQGMETPHPQGAVKWRLEMEELWDPFDANYSPMLAKLQYSSRVSMGLKTPEEVRAAGQAERLKERNRKAGRQVAHLLELHIRVMHIQPPIWRRVEVPGNLTLAQFHDLVLCPTIGWVRNQRAYKLRPARAEKGEAWYGPVHSSAPDLMHAKISGNGMADDTRVTIGELLFEAGDELAYIYNLGQLWDHKITVVRRIKSTPDSSIPTVKVLDGWGACPAENCPNISTYVRQLVIIADPQHPEYRRTLDLLREAPNKRTAFYDPFGFDLEAARLAVAEAIAPRSAARGLKALESTQKQLGGQSSVPELRRVCDVCGNPATNPCAGCHSAWYCSVEHQKYHWKRGHNQACREAPGKRAEEHARSSAGARGSSPSPSSSTQSASSQKTNTSSLRRSTGHMSLTPNQVSSSPGPSSGSQHSPMSQGRSSASQGQSPVGQTESITQRQRHRQGPSSSPRNVVLPDRLPTPERRSHSMPLMQRAEEAYTQVKSSQHEKSRREVQNPKNPSLDSTHDRQSNGLQNASHVLQRRGSATIKPIF